MTLDATNPTLQEYLPLTLAAIANSGLPIVPEALPAQRPFDAYGYWQFKLVDGAKAMWPTGHTIQEYRRWPSVTFGMTVMEAYYQDIQNYMSPPVEPETVTDEIPTTENGVDTTWEGVTYSVDSPISTEEPTA